MRDDYLLLNPGPVPVDRDVRQSMAAPMVYHRSPPFKEVYDRAADGLEYAFTRSTPDEERTASGGQPLILQGTSTMAMEAAVTNFVDREGTVLALDNGAFGGRFATIADRHASATRLSIDWGESFDLADVEAAITDDIDLVTMVHTETSTGLANPVAEVGELVADTDALLVVDAVSTVGGDEFRIDDWGVDVAVTGTQKALGAPPGLSALYVGEEALESVDGERTTLYHDLDRHLRLAEHSGTASTSAIPLIRALAAVGDDIREEGMPARIARHRRRTAAYRDGFRIMGLDLFAEPEAPTEYANTLAAVSLPEPVRGSADPFFDGVLDRGVSIAGGHSHLGGQIFRVSTMGDLADEDILRGIRAIGEALDDAGAAVDVEAGLDAARDALEK